MSNFRRFLDLPDADPQHANVLLLPLPYESTVCYGRGTARGPDAVWTASRHVECWDEELDWDLDRLAWFSSDPVMPPPDMSPNSYLQTVFQRAKWLHQLPGLVAGVGGEHGLTPSLLAASCPDPEDMSDVTVVQIDAHSDLRDRYEGTRHSHACAMRRVVDLGATVVAIGIRSAEREEFRYGQATQRVRTYFAHQLASDDGCQNDLLRDLSRIQGKCYVTVDMDGLDCSLCPATGTPQPGGLEWWQTLRYLKCLLHANRDVQLVGFDVVETVPFAGSQVNELAAAKLLTKVAAYWFQPRQ